VDELAARSGIAKTAVYHHFGSKEGLLAAVVERAAAAWIEGIARAALEAGDDPGARLERALAGMRALLEEKPWVLKLLQVLALEVAEEKPEIRATLRSILERARDAIVSGLNDALGVELPGAERVAWVVLAFLDGVSLSRQVAPDAVPLDEAFAELRRVVVLMVASRLSPELARGLDDPGPLKRPPQPADGPGAARPHGGEHGRNGNADG
jgi:AcrR family transcriptional regulator